MLQFPNMEIKDIEKLAKLARIELTEEEKVKYLKEIGAILGYVDQIKGAVAKTGEERKVPELRNVMREDTDKNQSGVYSKDLVAEFPRKEGDYLKVKKILG
jgi:aspartyl-tRNA(Asn)/glutamyl-tRNA(Gln) amidotransferase subunit C